MKAFSLFLLGLALLSCGGRPLSDSHSSSTEKENHLLDSSSLFSSFDASKISLEEDQSMLNVDINGAHFALELVENESTRALKDLLPLELEMSSMEHEKYCYLGSALPTASYAPGRIEAGDVMLFQDDCLVFFYESFNTPYSYTRLGKLTSTDDLLEACSSSSTIIKITK